MRSSSVNEGPMAMRLRTSEGGAKADVEIEPSLS